VGSKTLQLLQRGTRTEGVKSMGWPEVAKLVHVVRRR
jgi:hypothetical protein